MLIHFIVEVESLGGELRRDFETFQRVISTLRISALPGGRFVGAHFDQGGHLPEDDETCLVPFFGYNYANKKKSPVLPDIKLLSKHGVRRFFGGYGSVDEIHEGLTTGVMGTFEVPLQPRMYRKKKVTLRATVTVCGAAVRHPVVHQLKQLDPQHLPKPKKKAKVAKRKKMTFSELKRLTFCNSDKLMDKATGKSKLFQMGDRRTQWVGIGMVDAGLADGTEVLVTEDDGSVPVIKTTRKRGAGPKKKRSRKPTEKKK